MNKQEICKVLNAGRNRGIWEALVEFGIIALVVDENGRNVPALRVIVHTEEVECPPPPLPCSVVLNGIEVGEGGAFIDIEGTLATHVSLHYNFNDGETEEDLPCTSNTGSLPFGDGGMFLSTPGVTVFTVNASNDECATVCSSASFTNYCDTVYVPESGDDTVFTPDDLPVCDGEVVFTEFVSLGDLVGVTLDSETGAITVPAQTVGEGAIFGYYMTCDGVLVATVVINVANVPLGLRMVFDDNDNAPVADPSAVGNWNTFYDLPANGTSFSSVVVSGNQDVLVGGGAMTIKAAAFFGNTALLGIHDDGNVVDEIMNAAFSGSSITDATFNSATTIGVAGQVGAFKDATSLVNLSLNSATTFANGPGDGCIQGCTSIVNLSLPSAITLSEYFVFGCTSLETFSAPLATDLPSAGMGNCTSITNIDLTSCVNLGADPTDNSVWQGINGQIITLTIAAVNATNNGGNEHASIALLRANNTLTCNYV